MAELGRFKDALNHWRVDIQGMIYGYMSQQRITSMDGDIIVHVSIASPNIPQAWWNANHPMFPSGSPFSAARKTPERASCFSTGMARWAFPSKFFVLFSGPWSNSHEARQTGWPKLPLFPFLLRPPSLLEPREEPSPLRLGWSRNGGVQRFGFKLVPRAPRTNTSVTTEGDLAKTTTTITAMDGFPCRCKRQALAREGLLPFSTVVSRE
ncbi:hypothetical protein B0T10DRAFT_475830 [Thelonectria olida]|uniref:Uncharacterized protein n=1 Tax=Thelonectria olida TaxID=1576542 RepID=A0A9P8WF00_9HYPO|nr:hypothetical protein B0T10DRAFT_475830 [Thelonectria olida]